MLRNMSKGMRTRAAMMMVALYAFCVAFPPAALAMSEGALSAHCISKESKTAAMQHDHGGSDSKAENHQLAQTDAENSQDGMDAKHKQSKICCGISCMSAIPSDVYVATLSEFVALKLRPSAQRIIVGSQPDFLNRPPIVL